MSDQSYEIKDSKAVVTEIKEIHFTLEGYYEKSVAGAIRIGELLTQIKAELPHGQFTGWIEENLPFTVRTAQRFTKIYQTPML